MNFMNKTNPIGVLDFGYEGLRIVKTMIQYLPNERLIYCSSSSVGVNNSEYDFREYAITAAGILLKKNSKVIVIVSPTLKENILEDLRSYYKQIVFIPFTEVTQSSLSPTKIIEDNLHGMGLRCPLLMQAKCEFYVEEDKSFVEKYRETLGSKPDYVERIKILS